MATIQDAIKRLIYQFTSTGADKVAADNNMVADSQAKLAVSAQTTTKASLDLEKSFQNLERRFQTTAGVQQQYEAIQAKVNATVAQHPELQARANEVLANAAAKFDAAKGSGNAFAQMMESARGAALGLAAGIGPIGAVLGSFGPWGVAAAAGIGLVVNALDYMKVNAEKIGDASSGIKLFADNVGLTVTQIRGLNEAGSEVGVSSDQISAGIEKFTLNLSDARKGTGSLYDQLRLISPQLAEDVASTHDGAEAFDLLTKAINSTTDATTKAAIAKAAFGKGGQSLVQVAGVVGDAGGIDAYSTSVQKALGVTDEWTKKVADLRNENKSLEEDLKLIEASVYTQGTLQRQNTFLKQQIDIAKALRDAAAASSEYFESGGSGPQTDEFGAPFDFTLLNKNKAASAAATAPAASFDDRFSAAASGGAKSIDSLTQAQQSNVESTSRMAAASAALVSALGADATAAEKEQARIEALTVAFESGKISAETYARALNSDTARAAAQVTAISKSWGDVGQSTALALQAASNNLPVIEAVGGAAKMAAQYTADYKNAMDAGKSATDAAALAASSLAAKQAEVNAAAKETLFSLQNQAAAAAAVTGSEKISAQASATYNQMKHDGVDASIASAAAAAQEANARANASAIVREQAHQIENQTEMMKVQGTAQEATTAAAQAYDTAIRSGADHLAASALYSATLANNLERARQAEQARINADIDAANLTKNGQVTADSFTQLDALNKASLINQGNPFDITANPNHPVSYRGGGTGKNLDAGVGGSHGVLAAQLVKEMEDQGKVAADDFAAQVAANTAAGTAGLVNNILIGGGGIDSAITAAMKSTYSDTTSTLGTLFNIKNSNTTDKNVQIGNDQQFLTWLQGQPQTTENLQAITSLTSEMESLKNSTDGLNSTMQDALSPYYNQDPRTSHIGFRSQGMASTGYIDIPGTPSANDNMTLTLPVASGERVNVGNGPNRGAQNINVTNNITISGNINKDEFGRTMFQIGQTQAKQIALASR